MKDKTDSMNMDYGGEGAVNGYTNPGTPRTEHERKLRQQRWANLEDNEGLQFYEGMKDYDVDSMTVDGKTGFLPRNNYEDRN